MSTGSIIRKLRRDRNLTQVYVAEKLGMAHPGYHRYEAGQTIPPPDKLQKLADLFGVTPDFLLGRHASAAEDPEAVSTHMLPDEVHMATALYLLQRAVCGRDLIPGAQMHALLRDASMHCEAARKHWTKEARDQIEEVGRIVGLTEDK